MMMMIIDKNNRKKNSSIMEKKSISNMDEPGKLLFSAQFFLNTLFVRARVCVCVCVMEEEENFYLNHRKEKIKISNTMRIKLVDFFFVSFT